MTNLRIRQRIEEAEESLSPFASKSKHTKGRLHDEKPCPIRTAFQRDCHRITYSKAFRRLKHKTQVFIAPPGDHYVTRLTHTLEVSQIARTISRALNLNEDLTEAIALGHDLGHTPFGHVGEDVLNSLYSEGFHHNEQSLRVVDLLEKDGKGLNLTWEVRDGILNHSKSNLDIFGKGWTEVGTSEGQVVKISDLIAFINHDIGDAIRAGIIAESDLPDQVTRILGHSSSKRINTLVIDIIEYTSRSISTLDTKTLVVSMSPRIVEISNILRDFLFDKVYNPIVAKKETRNAQKTVQLLYEYFLKHENQLPPEYGMRDDSIERKVVDYVAGMTDQYAEHKAREVLRKNC